MIVRAWGETTIAGLPVKFENDGEVPLATGKPMLLFLSVNKETGKYVIYGGYAFELINGRRLKPRITESVVDPRLVGRDIADIVTEVRAVRR